MTFKRKPLNRIYDVAAINGTSNYNVAIQIDEEAIKQSFKTTYKHTVQNVH